MSDDECPWLAPQQHRVWRLWLEVATELPAALNRQLSSDSDLSLQDFEVLAHLGEVEDHAMRVVALAERMGWERSRLSHHLTRMEARGLVVRRSVRTDGRGALVELTAAGTEAFSRALPGLAEMVGRVVFGGLEPRQLDDFEAVLTRIHEQLSRAD